MAIYEDKFNFFVGIDLEKSGNETKDDSTKYDNMIFTGIASDNSEDSQGERLEPSGFDLTYLKKSGLLNLDHLPSRSPVNKSRFWIGEPVEANVTKNGLLVKGKLWKSSPEARAFWDKACEMKESGSSRKPGMSIEGRALERDPKNPKRITKALITNIALTMNPVNANSYLDIVKGKQKKDFIDYEFESDKDFSTTPILELERNGKVISIDSNFRISIRDKETPQRFNKDQFDFIFKNYKEGKLSKPVFDDYIKNMEKVCNK